MLFCSPYGKWVNFAGFRRSEVAYSRDGRLAGGMNLKIAEMDAPTWAKQAHKPELVVGVHESPWGRVLLGFVGLDLAALYLVERGAPEAAAIKQFAAAWPGAAVRSDNKGTAAALKKAVAAWRGGQGAALRVLLKGTAFQCKVWRALLEIPRGATVTYGEIARRVHQPQAARAVGGAVGANPVAVLVPCHRVLAANHKLGGYAWGPERKRMLLKAEGVTA
jgi:AraC family transcriptional regulator of adaptative response/methylated-DNA-[protein]-cysteine methyltransferase